MADRVIKLTGRGLRGESYGDVLRRSGLYGILPTDSDAEAIGKLNADAAASAALAESVAGPTYPNTGAGIAATTDGEAFAVDNGDGTVTIYLNDGGVAEEQRTLATTAALASPGGGSMVGLELGGNGNDAIKFITSAMAGIPDDGDEGADVTAELTALAAQAASLQLEVRLGKRTYLTDGTTIEFATSVTGTGIGTGDTMIKSTSTGTDGPVVRLIGPSTLSNLTIDGNVSDDPSPWNSGNYDSFTGSEGLIVDSDDCTVRNVVIQNVRRAAFKVELPNKRVKFENCASDRSRGNFGDGFIAMGAEQVSYENCRAHDFTRIGFVSDSYGDQPGTFSDVVSYLNCVAEYGHDASINFGGQEANAGFWNEKSGNVTRINCVALDCGNRGFTDATGEDVDGSGTVQFVSINCLSVGAEQGYIAQGLDGVRLNAVFTNCRAIVSGLTGFSFSGGLVGDVITMNACSSVLSSDQVSRSSVKASPGTTIINGFTEIWETVNTTYRDAADNYYGSLSHFADAIEKVVVSDWRTYDSGGTAINSVFKFLPSTVATLKLNIARCYLRGVYINALEVNTLDVVWDRLGSIECTAGLVTIRGGINYETSTPFSSPIFNTSRGFVFDGVMFDFDTSGGAMHFRNIDSTSPYSKLNFRGCTFRKDFETDDHAVLFDMLGGPAGTIAGTTDANHIYATDIVAINTGGATTNPVFFIDSNTDAAGKLNGDGKKTSSITNMVQSGKLAASASYTAWGA